MPTLTDLALRQAGLAEADVDWLHMLLADWQLLADLSLADLVLWAQLRAGSGWVALAQIRPVTAPTAIPDDIVGSVEPAGVRPFLDVAMQERRICRGGDPEWTTGVPVRHATIPRTRDGRVIPAIRRSTHPAAPRPPGRLGWSAACHRAGGRGLALGRADHAQGRYRAAAPGARADHQGRDDQGDPPPRQEQPADRRGAAAAAGAQAQCSGSPRRARGSRAQGGVDRDRPRDPLACPG